MRAYYLCSSMLALPKSRDLASYKINDWGQSLLIAFDSFFKGLGREHATKKKDKTEHIINLFFIIVEYYASYIH